VTELILPVRHSPGTTRREATRDTSETGYMPDSSVREVSCFVPLQRHLHAVCQRGALRKMRSEGRLLLRFETRWNSSKARAFSVLLRFDLRDSRTRWNIGAAGVIPRRFQLRAKLGKIIGKRDSIWGRVRFTCALN
jgi:hypothetical protein